VPLGIPGLRAGDAHVWLADLEVDEETHGRLRSALGQTEIERSSRFRFARDRDRFIVRRGVLREILGHYLGMPPERVRFRSTRFGKPILDLEAQVRDLRFNLSHSHGLALVGITRDREIGVDIERIVPERADRQVAERFFAPGEIAALQDFAGRAWVECFFHCWTRKEAYVKALGEGLSLPLDRFEVSVVPSLPPDSPAVRGIAGERERWRLENIGVGREYVAAAVVERPVRSITRLEWRPRGAG